MTASTSYRQLNRVDTQSEIRLPGFGLFDGASLDLANKRMRGATYFLKPGAKQKILESLGFSANFKHASIASASCNIANSETTVTLDLDKNAKPNDVAVRYSAERWQTERASTTTDGLRPWLKNTYRSRSLPPQSSVVICEVLSIAEPNLDKYLITIDLKNEKVALLVGFAENNLLPESHIATFSLPEIEIDATPPTVIEQKAESQSFANPPEAKKALVQSNPPTERRKEDMNSTQPRYATYSQSEVDQLLRQQSEQLNGTIQAKVAAQRKEIAESLKANEKQLKLIADEMKIEGEELRNKLDQSFNAKSSTFAETTNKASADLTQQIEAFKTHINKNVLPSLKNIDDRIRSVIEQSNPEQSVETTSKAPMILASLALFLSVVNFALNFLKY